MGKEGTSGNIVESGGRWSSGRKRSSTVVARGVCMYRTWVSVRATSALLLLLLKQSIGLLNFAELFLPSKRHFFFSPLSQLTLQV